MYKLLRLRKVVFTVSLCFILGILFSLNSTFTHAQEEDEQQGVEQSQADERAGTQNENNTENTLQEAEDTDTKTNNQEPNKDQNEFFYERAEVVDAEEINNVTPDDFSNTQRLSLRILSGENKNVTVDTELFFPNGQIKSPLNIGETLIVKIDENFLNSNEVTIVSFYKQNNIAIILVFCTGLFLLIGNFRTNYRFTYVILNLFISAVVTYFLFTESITLTYFANIFSFITISFIANVRIFKKRTPALFFIIGLTSGIFVSAITVFILNQFDIVGSAFFDLFINSNLDQSTYSIYLLILLVLQPLLTFITDSVIQNSIKIRQEKLEITRSKLISQLTSSLLNSYFNVFLLFFGIIFAIIIVIISSVQNDSTLSLIVLNSNYFSQTIGFFLAILLSIIIYIPIVSLISGSWLGSIESHKLIDDKNYTSFR